MKKYNVIVKCRQTGAIGEYGNRIFVVVVDCEGEPTRLQIITAWESQWGAMSPDEKYELHHVVSWRPMEEA
jgi:hypothetical protein